MAYITDGKNLIGDIISRKEFYMYKPREDYELDGIIPRFAINKLMDVGIHLRLKSTQLFIQNFVNPNTPYNRLLIKWDVGTGKTIAALGIAMKFIEYYNRETEYNPDGEIGSIFVISFTENVFKKELIRFPEFGFMSHQERSRYERLKNAATNGASIDIAALQEFLFKIKKRFNNRKGNGFFRFYGYKAFVNRLFISRERINLGRLTESQIKKHIESGKIKINTQLLNQFKNSLIICDEIHNVYNSLEKNNWGMAIQYLIDNVPSVRAVFMSATPINNNPTELIDLFNLLLPKNLRIAKDDIFIDDKTLKPGAEEKIAELSIGRISFLRDVNPKFYPEKKFIGERINGITYLRFIRCPMSNFQYATYKKMKSVGGYQDNYIIDYALPNPEDENIGIADSSDVEALAFAPQEWKNKNNIDYVNDAITGEFVNIKTLGKFSSKYHMILQSILAILKNNFGKIMIYHNLVHKSGILFMQEVLLRNGFIDEYGPSHDNTLCTHCGKRKAEHTILGGNKIKDNEIVMTNQGLFIGNQLIVSYSIDDNGVYYINSGGFTYPDLHSNSETKIEIIKHLDHHPLVIQYRKKAPKPLLLPFKDEDDDYVYYSNMETFDTEYIINHHRQYVEEEHKLRQSKMNEIRESKELFGGGEEHKFNPCRFIIVHSDIDRNSVIHSLEKFSHPNNTDGNRFFILIGSGIIKESLDIKALRHIMITGRPDNISILKQIIGRGVRQNSHALLPPDKRNVNIYIYTASPPNKEGLSSEEEKYKEKVGHYLIVQKIERIFHENAIDSLINRKIIWSEANIEKYKKDKEMASFDILYFDEKPIKNIYKLNELNLGTFTAFHQQGEIKYINMIIKRLFIEYSHIWTFNDLYAMVKNPPFYTEMNTELIDLDIFTMCFHMLVWNNKNYVNPYDKNSYGIVEKLNDTYNMFIPMPNGDDYVIYQIDKYYILVYFDGTQPRAIMESINRFKQTQSLRNININTYIKLNPEIHSYESQFRKFINKWERVSISNMELVLCEYSLNFHSRFIEDCITYIFKVWTSSDITKSQYHSFYFKMLYYYDLRGVIIWANTAKKFIAQLYNDYANPVETKLRYSANKLSDEEVGAVSSNLINLLRSSINNSLMEWLPNEAKKHYKDKLEASLKLFVNNKKVKSLGKVDADILPVGHIIQQIPRFYNPAEEIWFESPEYLKVKSSYIENDVVIGYEERIPGSIRIKFKIRQPIQHIKKFKDIRMIEKGSACSSKSKEYLLALAKKLGLSISEKENITAFCNQIKIKLTYNEMQERSNKTNVKWYYFYYEEQPKF